VVKSNDIVFTTSRIFFLRTALSHIDNYLFILNFKFMSNLKQITQSLSITAFIFYLIIFFGSSCRKDGKSLECRYCTAKYNSGMIAGQRDVCSDLAEKEFRDEFNYADKIECK
jgi:hypothetical protein